MSSKLRFCTNCGSQVGPGSRFCGQCGHPLQSAPKTQPPPPVSGRPQGPGHGPATPPPPPVSRGPERRSHGPATPPPAPTTRGEQILGIVPVGKRAGKLGMRQDSYNMIVTPSNLVFAYLSPQLQKTAVQQAREQAKQRGKGFFGQWGAQLAWMSVLHDQYRKMSMEAILSQYPGSFVIPRNQIQKVRFKDQYDQESGNRTQEIILRTAGGKYRFKLLAGNMRAVKQLLR